MSMTAGDPAISPARLPGIPSGNIVRWCLLAAALLGLLLINLGKRGLNEPDEGRYSNIAGEMIEGGHGWWEPHMSDFAHYDKPPMTYWITAGAFEVFGKSEWAARIPTLLGAVMALVGLGWAAWRLYGSRTAWWAVLFCGTLGQFWVLARMLTPDMLLTGFVTLAIGFWAEERHRGARGHWWWGCVLCMTLAWWTKATAALVPLLGLAAGLWVTRDRAGLRALRPLRLLLLMLIFGAPWYVAMMSRHPELKGFFFGRELTGRIIGHPDGRRGPVYFHVAFSLLGWAPWWPAALASWVMRRKELIEHWRRQGWQAVPLEAWLVITGLTVFSVLSSKLVTYTLPLAPWAALWCARAIMGRTADEPPVRRIRQVYGSAAACAVLFVIASFALPHWESRLGANSTLREVSRQLRLHHAAVAYVDRYAPGMEFYFGESVYYVTGRFPGQIPSDAGTCEMLGEPHFLKPADFAAHVGRQATHDIWLVRYRGRKNSPLCAVLPLAAARETVWVGDFALDRVPAVVAASPAATRITP